MDADHSSHHHPRSNRAFAGFPAWQNLQFHTSWGET
jgi:hypothetical protein